LVMKFLVLPREDDPDQESFVADPNKDWEPVDQVAMNTSFP